MSRADRFTTTNLQNQIYSDCLTDFNRHPVSGDIVRYVNENAVIRSIKNLILTNKGERFCQPDIGCNIQNMLFEPMSDAMAQEIQSEIRNTLTNHEPRCSIVACQVVADYDNDAYIVTLTIMILNQQDTSTFAVTLTRVR